jgi:hypothetical protein
MDPDNPQERPGTGTGPAADPAPQSATEPERAVTEQSGPPPSPAAPAPPGSADSGPATSGPPVGPPRHSAGRDCARGRWWRR